MENLKLDGSMLRNSENEKIINEIILPLQKLKEFFLKFDLSYCATESQNEQSKIIYELIRSFGVFESLFLEDLQEVKQNINSSILRNKFLREVQEMTQNLYSEINASTYTSLNKSINEWASTVKSLIIRYTGILSILIDNIQGINNFYF